jgi:hypothetical protein
VFFKEFQNRLSPAISFKFETPLNFMEDKKIFTSKNDIRKAPTKGINTNTIREMIEGNKKTQAATCELYHIEFIFPSEYFTIITNLEDWLLYWENPIQQPYV